MTSRDCSTAEESVLELVYSRIMRVVQWLLRARVHCFIIFFGKFKCVLQFLLRIGSSRYSLL